MKRSIVFAIILMAYSLVFCQSSQEVQEKISNDKPSYNFANLEWGSDKETTKSTLTQKGYSFSNEFETGDLFFEGEIKFIDCYILSKISQTDGLQKVIVIFSTASSKPIDKYHEIQESLVKKYGEPNDEFEFFSSPYEAGDGYEEVALSVGKGHFSSFWMNEDNNTSMGIQINEKLNVVVSYEGPEWSKELNRRNTEATSDL